MDREELVSVNAESETIVTREEKSLIFKKIHNGRKISHKKVPEINEKQVKDYKLIGCAKGQDLFHCVSIARKYVKNFNKRVAAYLIIKPPQKRCSFAVAFYEKKS